MSRFAVLFRNLIARLPGGRRLRAELDQALRQRDRLARRLDKSEQQRHALRARLDALRQRSRAAQSDETVLEQVLPLRTAAMLAANHDGRAARESAFAEKSESYREALMGIATAPTGAERVLAGGLTWWIPAQPGESEGMAQRLARRRRLPLRELLDTRELAQGCVMIDIGANVGTTSIPRVLLGDFACVYAIEPDPGNYACLVRNVVANGVRGLVLPDRVAIGDVEGEVVLRAMKSGTHHLVRRAADVKEDERVTVPCVTLDTWIDRMQIDLSDVFFIKSDTQGWDARVLAGAARVLARKHIAWQVEFSPAMLQRSGCSRADVYALLERHFTHFIDVRSAQGAHVRAIRDLSAALAYVGTPERAYTNLLLYSAAPLQTS